VQGGRATAPCLKNFRVSESRSKILNEKNISIQ